MKEKIHKMPKVVPETKKAMLKDHISATYPKNGDRMTKNTLPIKEDTDKTVARISDTTSLFI